MLNLPSQQHTRLKPQLRTRRINLHRRSIGHFVNETEEGCFVLVQAGGFEVVRSDVADEEGSVGEDGDCDSLSELDGSVFEFEGFGGCHLWSVCVVYRMLVL